MMTQDDESLSASQAGQQNVLGHLATTFCFEVVGNQERHVCYQLGYRCVRTERLLVVQAGITVGSVVERKVFVLQLHRATDTLGLKSAPLSSSTYDRVAVLVDFTGKLEVDTTKNGAELAVDRHRASNLMDDVREETSL